jgi:hypothetical protein
VPTREAVDAAAKADVNGLMVVRPGMAVALDLRVDAPGDMQARIVDTYTKRLTKAGLKVDPAAPLKLVATSTPGNSTEIRFVNRPDVGSRTLTDLSFRLAYELNGQTLWERKGSYTASARTNYTLKENQTIDQLLAEEKQNALKFFETSYVPGYVQKTDGKSIGLGNTALGPEGLPGDSVAAAPAPAPVNRGDGLE